jgi:predicted GTPase
LDTVIDQQVANALQGVERLETVIQSPGGALAADAVRLATCAEAISELAAIRRRLEQFARATKGLNYIGFLGHYSAGKSSTINSLLALTADAERRQTDFHPTDVSITYCTHPENKQSVLGTYRRGHIQVGTYFLENDLLKEFVVVDTPGAGDTAVEEEIVRDFIPLFDHIIYVVNAAVPIDRSELHIIKLIAEHLSFIPFTIVVTRADEFALDKRKPLITENLDLAKRAAFTTTLLKRLATVAPALSASPENVVFIDNEQSFGISGLRENIFKSTVNPVALHSSKIRYFRDSIQSIREFFLKHANFLATTADKLLAIALANDEEYNSTLKFYTDDSLQWWRKTADEFLNKSQSFESNRSKWAGSISSQRESARVSLANIPQTNFRHSASDLSKTQFLALTREFENAYKDLSDAHKRKVLEYLRADDALEKAKWPEPSRVDVDAVLFAERFKTNTAPRLDAIVRPVKAEMCARLLTQIATCNDALRQLVSQVRQKDISTSERQVFLENTQRISDALQTFAQQVYVYVSAITAIGASNYIEHLSLSAQLSGLGIGKIDASEQDSQREAISSTSYRGREDLISNLDKYLDEANRKISGLQAELIELNGIVEHSKDGFVWNQRADDFNEDKVLNIFENVQERLAARFDSAISEVRNALTTGKELAEAGYNDQMKAAVQKYWRWLKITAVVGTIIAIAVMLTSLFIGVPEEWSFNKEINCATQVGAPACKISTEHKVRIHVTDCSKLAEQGLASSVGECGQKRSFWWVEHLIEVALIGSLWNLIVYGFGKLLIREGLIKSRSKEEFYKQQTSETINKVHEISWTSPINESETALHIDGLSLEIDRICKARLLASVIDLQEQSTKFQDITGRCLAELSSYAAAWKTAAAEITSWYTDAGRTSLPLLSAAAVFKAKAVSPCIQLFQEKKSEILREKEILQEISI